MPKPLQLQHVAGWAGRRERVDKKKSNGYNLFLMQIQHYGIPIVISIGNGPSKEHTHARPHTHTRTDTRARTRTHSFENLTLQCLHVVILNANAFRYSKQNEIQDTADNKQDHLLVTVFTLPFSLLLLR